MIRRLKQLSPEDSGATMIEYCFMLALIAAVAYGAIQTLGQSALGLFSTVSAAL